VLVLLVIPALLTVHEAAVERFSSGHADRFRAAASS